MGDHLAYQPFGQLVPNRLRGRFIPEVLHFIRIVIQVVKVAQVDSVIDRETHPSARSVRTRPRSSRPGSKVWTSSSISTQSRLTVGAPSSPTKGRPACR